MRREAWLSVQVTSSKRSITGVVERLKYEDTVEKDNLTEIHIKSENAYDMADDPDMVEGTNLTYQWGWLQGEASAVHTGDITDVDVDYGEERVTMVIKILDGGQDMKKDNSQGGKVWANVTSSDIAKSIAQKYGYAAQIQITNDKHTSLPQGKKNDFEFLKTLAEEENFNFYVRAKKIYFQKKDLTQASCLSFAYRANIIKFSPRFKKSEQLGESGGVQGQSYDPISGKMVTNQVDSTNETNNGQLGPKMYDLVSNQNGVYKNVYRNYIQPPLIDQNDKTPTKQGLGLKEKGKKKHHESTLKVLGEPSLLSDCVITIGAVAKRHAGNWYVKKATHDVTSTGAYFTSTDLDKNAGDEGTKQASDVNNTQGPKSKPTKVTLLASTANGTPRSDNTVLHVQTPNSTFNQ